MSKRGVSSPLTGGYLCIWTLSVEVDPQRHYLIIHIFFLEREENLLASHTTPYFFLNPGDKVSYTEAPWEFAEVTHNFLKKNLSDMWSLPSGGGGWGARETKPATLLLILRWTKSRKLKSSLREKAPQTEVDQANLTNLWLLKLFTFLFTSLRPVDETTHFQFFPHRTLGPRHMRLNLHCEGQLWASLDAGFRLCGPGRNRLSSGMFSGNSVTRIW